MSLRTLCMLFGMGLDVATSDSQQGESGGGKSLTSKLKAKVPHSRGVKDKVKNLKNRLPGMKKHNGDDDLHEDSSEYDENSPRVRVPATPLFSCFVTLHLFDIFTPICSIHVQFDHDLHEL